MSQEKVDRYKKEKANRQKIMKKEKLLFRLEIGGLAAVLAALVIWFSMAVLDNVQTGKENAEPATVVSMNVDGMQDYLDSFNTTDDAAE